MRTVRDDLIAAGSVDPTVSLSSALPVRSSVGSLVGVRGEEPVDSPPLTDLVNRAGGGDQQAWRDLVNRYANLVWSVARSHRLDHADAADVCQTTWLRLAEHLGSLREPSRLPGWLATTARRESLRVIAGRRREAPGALPDEPDPDPSAGPETLVLTEDRDNRLWQAFGGLTERCQQLLRILSSAPELSYAEVGVVLGIPVGSIGPTRGRCLESLRRRLVASDFTGSDFGGSGMSGRSRG
jgi:RNA polymerase sigma factor (sigma-70 family)